MLHNEPHQQPGLKLQPRLNSGWFAAEGNDATAITKGLVWENKKPHQVKLTMVLDYKGSTWLDTSLVINHEYDFQCKQKRSYACACIQENSSS